MTTVRVRARTVPSRCARCLDDLDADPWSCPACATALHQDCRLEWGPCPTLGCSPRGAGVELTIRLSERHRWFGRVCDVLARAFDWSVLYGTPIGVWAFLAGVAPAFARMFREVGVNLPPATEATLWLGSWARTPVGLLALVGLLDLLRRANRTRPQLPAVVFVAGLVVVGLLGFSLFLPCIEITQKL